jgi:hypothetical protein
MTAAGMLAGFKIPVAIALDPVTVQVIPYITDALGMAYGFEQSSTGMTRGVRWAEHRDDVSAAQYTGLGSGVASGIAYVVNHEMGYLNVSRWSPEFAYSGATGIQMSSTWVRLAVTPTIADWAMHFGVGKASGTSWVGSAAAVAPATHAQVKTEGTVVDFQAQGALGEMETSVYAQYSVAPKSSGAIANKFNAADATDRKAITVGADFSVIPHTLHVGAAYRVANTGLTTAEQTAGAGDKDNSITVTAVYDLFQNVALHANYSMRSGSAYNAGGTKDATTVAADGSKGSKNLMTLMLEAAW